MKRNKQLFVASMVLAVLTGSSQAMAADRLLNRDRIYSDDYQALFENVSTQDQVRLRDPSIALENPDLVAQQDQIRLRDPALQDPSLAVQDQTRLRDQLNVQDPAYSGLQTGTQGSVSGFSGSNNSAAGGHGSAGGRGHR